jgi:hypothetical protein
LHLHVFEEALLFLPIAEKFRALDLYFEEIKLSHES